MFISVPQCRTRDQSIPTGKAPPPSHHKACWSSLRCISLTPVSYPTTTPEAFKFKTVLLLTHTCCTPPPHPISSQVSIPTNQAAPSLTPPSMEGLLSLCRRGNRSSCSLHRSTLLREWWRSRTPPCTPTLRYPPWTLTSYHRCQTWCPRPPAGQALHFTWKKPLYIWN